MNDKTQDQRSDLGNQMLACNHRELVMALPTKPTLGQSPTGIGQSRTMRPIIGYGLECKPPLLPLNQLIRPIACSTTGSPDAGQTLVAVSAESTRTSKEDRCGDLLGKRTPPQEDSQYRDHDILKSASFEYAHKAWLAPSYESSSKHLRQGNASKRSPIIEEDIPKCPPIMTSRIDSGTKEPECHLLKVQLESVLAAACSQASPRDRKKLLFHGMKYVEKATEIERQGQNLNKLIHKVFDSRRENLQKLLMLF